MSDMDNNIDLYCDNINQKLMVQNCTKYFQHKCQYCLKNNIVQNC